MPNWAEGTLKLRGRKENIALAEISKGEVIKDICNDKFDNYIWDVPFGNFGG